MRNRTPFSHPGGLIAATRWTPVWCLHFPLHTCLPAPTILFPAALPTGTGPRRTLDRSLTVRAKQLALLDPTGLAGLSGGGSAHKAAEVFKRHDSDASGYLDAEEMMAALQDLGMLEGMKAKALGEWVGCDG